jgi:protein gp37
MTAPQLAWDPVTRPGTLDLPLRRRRPARVAVCRASDLSGPAVPGQDNARIFAVMVLAQRHKLQVTTRQRKRLRSPLPGGTWPMQVAAAMERIQPRSLDRLPLNAPLLPLPNARISVTAARSQAGGDP